MAKSTFAGVPKEALRFFRDLRKNNNREWFDANKAVFVEKVRGPMEEFVAAVDAEVARFAPAYVTEPKKALYRIYNDTRFHKDKPPYKDHIGALLHRSDVSKNEGSAFYFAFNEKALSIAGGCYGPGPDQLTAIRSHLLDHHKRFEKLVQAPALLKAMGELQGTKLSRPPKGFPPETPGIEWIKGKQWYFYTELDSELATKGAGVTAVAQRLKLLTPFVEFLNEPLLAVRKRNAGFSL